MISSMMRYDIFSGKTLTFSVPRSRLRMPEERQEGQGTPGDEDETVDPEQETPPEPDAEDYDEHDAARDFPRA